MSRLPITYCYAPSRPLPKGETYPRPTPNPFLRNPSIEAFLRKPTWSVRSLLPEPPTTLSPSTTSIDPENTITPQQLHHLLRLSALPPPQTPIEERRMLRTLETQLHFVREMQKVDTTGVEPLVSIRDDTAEAVEEGTIGLADLKKELDAEEKVGKLGRVKRRVVVREDFDDGDGGGKARKGSDWGLFKMAEGKMRGRFFVVQKPTGKGEKGDGEGEGEEV